MKHANWTKLLFTLPVLAVALCGTLLFTGCSSEAPNAIEITDDAVVYQGEDVPFARTESVTDNGAASLGSGSGWYTVASTEVGSDGGAVTGGRWTLTVDSDAWDANAFGESVLFTIDERDPGLLDMQLGPDGFLFDKAATLKVDYSGTNVDPDSPNYDGTVPGFFGYDADTGAWEALPGTHDAVAKTFEVSISEITTSDTDPGSSSSSSSGFDFWGRYALFGTPGW